MTDETIVNSEKVEEKPDVKGEAKGGDLAGLQRAYQRALDETKKRAERIKELESKLAEAEPYRETFKNHEQAKQLEAQREAEARARQESEARNRQEIDSKKERAILRSLLGLNMPTEDAADFAFWKMANDPAIVFDPETGSFTGLAEARAKLAESPLFAAVKPGEPVKKPAPGLPVTGAPSTGGKFSGLKSFAELLALGAAAVAECHEKEPALYETLRRDQVAGAAHPTRVSMPAAARS